jgi:hypothetical protein
MFGLAFKDLIACGKQRKAVTARSVLCYYRVYFAYDGKSIILLLAGGSKQRQSKDIKTAKARWSDYKARK